MKIGDKVRVTKIPEGLPEGNRQLETLFKTCIGKTFEIAAFDGDLLELNVGEAFGKPSDYHKIWVGEEHVKLVQA